MPGKTHKRKNYFIKKGFQLRHALPVTLILLAVMSASGAGLYLGMWGSIIENFSAFRISEDMEAIKRITDYEESRFKRGDFRLEKIFRQAELLSEKDKMVLRRALESVNRSLIPKVAILAFLIFAGVILFSHKVAGPMYRFEKSARAISEGDLTASFRVRKGDQAQDTALILQGMAKSLRDDIEKIKAAVDDLSAITESLVRYIPYKENGERLNSAVEKINTLLSKYKT